MKKVKVIATFVILIVNISCGFTVIYDQKTGLNYEKELASIKIQKSQGTFSQKLRTNIYNVINPDNLNEELKYYLILSYKESLSSTFLTSAGSSGRNQITMTIYYKLKSQDDDQLISSGSVDDSESYNVNLNRYGTYTSEEDARSNLLRSLSRNIRNLLIQDIINLKKGLS